MSTLIIQEDGSAADNGGRWWIMAGAECSIMGSLAHPARCAQAWTAAERDKDQQPQWKTQTPSLFVLLLAAGRASGGGDGATDPARRGLSSRLAALTPLRQRRPKKSPTKPDFCLREEHNFIWKNPNISVLEWTNSTCLRSFSRTSWVFMALTVLSEESGEVNDLGLIHLVVFSFARTHARTP